MTGIGSINGKIGPLASMRVPVTDRGFLLGDAVYETLRTYRGTLFALDDHLDRLERSIRGIRIQDAPGRETLERWIRDTVAAARDAADPEFVVRVSVTRGSGPHGISPRGAGPAQVYVLVRSLPRAPEPLYDTGMRVVTAQTRRVARTAQDPSIKAGSALNLVLARIEADEAGADEALLLDERGDYLEASAANLFAVRGRTFWSARAEDGILEGVTMRHITALLDDEGFEPVWGPIPREALFAADEVFLTQTTREVLPVVAVDEVVIGTGRPGPVAARLRKRFLTEVVPSRTPA